MPLCRLSTEVSQMNSPIAQTLYKNQTLHGHVAYNWSYGHFWFFWPILAKIWLPWQRPLDPCHQKGLLWIDRPRKSPVISNHILVTSRRHAFICIYSNFSPEIGCHGNAPLSLVYGSVIMNSPIAQTLSKNQTMHWYVAYNWSYSHFCDFLAYFGQRLVAMATPLRPLQSEMSSLDWSTTKTPCYKQSHSRYLS